MGLAGGARVVLFVVAAAAAALTAAADQIFTSSGNRVGVSARNQDPSCAPHGLSLSSCHSRSKFTTCSMRFLGLY
jgi:hypothetical protein